MISQETIEKVNGKSLSSVVQSFLGGNLKKSGANYVAKCPFHTDKHASLTINDAKDVWKCFACDEGGKGGISFVKRYENVDFVQAVRKIAAAFNITVIDEPKGKHDSEEYKAKKAKKQSMLDLLDIAATHFQRLLKANRGGEVGDYLKQRYFSEETLTAFGIGYADESDYFTSYTKHDIQDLIDVCLCSSKDSPKDFFRSRLIFPLHDLVGKTVGFAGRELPPAKSKMKYLNSRDSDCYKKSEILYGYHIARKLLKGDAPIYFVEGYTNVMRLFESGLPAVASGGTSLSEMQVSHISKLTNSVVLLLDGDNAGASATLRHIPLFLESGMSVRVCMLPPGEDIDSIGKSIIEGELLGNTLNNNRVSPKININDSLSPYNSIDDYIKTHTVDWLNYKMSLVNGAELTPETKSKVTTHLCDLILTLPDVNQHKLWVKELVFYFGKDIFQTYKEVRLANKDEEEAKGLLKTVEIEENGGGIRVLGYGVANFSLRVLYIIDLRLDRKNGKQKYEWVLELWQKGKEPIVLFVPSDEFATGAAFHKYLAPLGYLYNASEDHHKYLIGELNLHLIRVNDINRMGWNKQASMFFFSNAAFPPNQTEPLRPDFTATVVHENKGYRMMHYKDAQQIGGVESPEYKQFYYEKTENTNLLEVATLIQTAWEGKAILTLCHSISTAFFDVIAKVTRFFPIFYAYSTQPSTGKSTLCQFCTGLWGNIRSHSIASENTSVPGLARVLQNTSNAVLLFDELKRNKSLGAKIDFFQQAYGLNGYTMTSNIDFESSFSFEVNTGMFMTANFLPLEVQHKAFRTRLLIYELNANKTPDSFTAYSRISKLMDENMSHIMVDILQHRDIIERDFRKMFDEYTAKFREKLKPTCEKMEERLFANAAIMIVPTIILLRHKLVELPCIENDLFVFACEMLEEQYEEESNVNSLYNFWLSVNEGIADRTLQKNSHFRIDTTTTDENGKNIECFRFRFDKLYSNYKKQQKGLGNSVELLADYELRGLLKRESYYMGTQDNARFKMDEVDIEAYKSRKNGKMPDKSTQPTSCVVINYDMLKQVVEIDL